MQRNPLYDPREDSYLLAEAVSIHAQGKVLDVGTGSGILAYTAANKKEVKSVLAVDINTEALVQAKKLKHHPLITYIQSDLFSNVDEKFDTSTSKASNRSQKHLVFDTIIFNPPYLPDDPNIRDVALDGGRKGYEISVRFLKEAYKYLEDDGQILFLFSSLTHKEVIDETLLKNNYLFEEIIKQKLDFEMLYVYKIKKIQSLIKDVKDINFFSKGKRGLIYTGMIKDEKVAIKIKNQRSEAKSRIFFEGKNLKEMNKIGIGPRLIKAEEDYLIYKFAQGELFPLFLNQNVKEDIIKVIIELFNQMFTLDKNQFDKEEMCNPYKHIIITKEKKVVLLDFERSKKNITPHNVTQFTQYLISSNIEKMLKTKDIKLDKDKMIQLAKDYKKNYDKKSYQKIVEAVN